MSVLSVPVSLSVTACRPDQEEGGQDVDVLCEDSVDAGPTRDWSGGEEKDGDQGSIYDGSMHVFEKDNPQE